MSVHSARKAIESLAAIQYNAERMLLILELNGPETEEESRGYLLGLLAVAHGAMKQHTGENHPLEIKTQKLVDEYKAYLRDLVIEESKI